jgi:asparagine synthase (glutamine-hydrolysing)
MCGICGIINFSEKPANDHLLKPMMEKMKHRGPDDEGTFTEGSIALGFVRLSIIDLSQAGHQPMFSDDGNLVLVYNGELYNYVELRQELTSLGHRFRTDTDTEVLLRSYQQWGEACMHRFNGMWAFVIHNRREKTIFASRDRWGVKPFYFYTDNDRFIFASEIPPILSILPSRPNPDYQSIFDFLVFSRTDQTEATFFDGIRKLQHGQKINIAKDQITISTWYDLRANLKEPFSSPEEFIDLMIDAVGLRMRSDVPVGVCLSGGIDSSTIVSILIKKFGKHDLKTFSAVYGKGDHGDESEYINEYKSSLQHMHFITPDANSLHTDIETFVQAHAEPIPSTSPYAQFKVMELAKGKAVVTIDGQGADEQLAGYHYFFGLYFKELLYRGDFALLTKESLAYLNNHRSIYGLKSFAYFMLPHHLRTSARISEKGYVTEEFADTYARNNTIAGNLYASKSLQEGLIDHFEYKLEHLLKWEDRNSMWFSLEAREPFLDYRLVERTLSMPSKDKISNGTTKHILREAVKGLVPEKIRVRKDKIGFGNPEAEWFRTPAFQNLVTDILNSQSFRERKIIDPEKAKKLYCLHLKRKINCSKEIWKWIHLDMWFRGFFASIIEFYTEIANQIPLLVEI